MHHIQVGVNISCYHITTAVCYRNTQRLSMQDNASCRYSKEDTALLWQYKCTADINLALHSRKPSTITSQNLSSPIKLRRMFIVRVKQCKITSTRLLLLLRESQCYNPANTGNCIWGVYKLLIQPAWNSSIILLGKTNTQLCPPFWCLSIRNLTCCLSISNTWSNYLNILCVCYFFPY